VVGTVEEFDWVSLKIEADRAIGAVVDDEPYRSAEGRETTAPSCKLLTKAVERLLYKRDGGCRQVEIDAQEYVDADERGDKERLGTGSFGNEDGVGPKRRPPSSLGAFAEISLGRFDGFIEDISRHFKRSGERADEATSPSKISCAKLFKPPQALGRVLVPATTHQFGRFQAKFFAAITNKGLDCQGLLLCVGHGKVLRQFD
jgi:hypothetical protein